MAEQWGIRGHLFKNWAETFVCMPELYFTPKTREDVRKILERARQEGKNVKVVGAGHSPSDIAFTDGFLISLQRMDSVLEIDREKSQVTVEAGMRLDKLNKILQLNDMALSVLPAISEISVAGAISTATHGTGQHFGNLASYVVRMELLTASGETLNLSMSENKEVFLAAVVGLGAVGIILSVTLQCEAAFRLCRTDYPLPLDDVLENLETHVKSSEHFRFMWMPYTSMAGCSHQSRSSKEISTKSSWFWDELLGYHILQLLYFISCYVPSFVPYIHQFMWNVLYRHPREIVDTSYKVFNFNCLFKQYVNEWAVPRDKAALVLKELQEWVLRNQDRGVFVHAPVEVRFVKADEIYLSPAYQTDICTINIIMYRPYSKDVPFQEYCNAYEDIMSKAGGRPHWAKAHRVTATQFRNMYPQFERFCAIRRSLDPHGLFLNDYLRRIMEMT